METAITLSIQGNPAYLRYAVISIGNLVARGACPSSIYIFIHSSLRDRHECIELSYLGINIIFKENVSKFAAIDYVCDGFQFDYIFHMDVDCSYSGEDVNAEILTAVEYLKESESTLLVQSQRKGGLSLNGILTDRLRLLKGSYRGNVPLFKDLLHCISGVKDSYGDFVSFLTNEEFWIYGGIMLVNKKKYLDYKHIVNILDSATYCDETVLMYIQCLNAEFLNYFTRYDFKQRVCDPNLDFNLTKPGFNHFASVDFRRKKELEINNEYLRIKELFKIK
jgi:hypothetical protein